ncbi:MAG: PaaI family thioesterase [Mycobacterium sp.]
MEGSRADSVGEWSGGDFVLAAPRDAQQVNLCVACSRTGECRLGLRAESFDGEIVTTDIVCHRDNEGGPRVAHGGWVAAVLDELVGHVPILHGQLSVTGTLTVRFIRPVPIERPLRGIAWVVRREASRWYVESRLELASNSAELAHAQAVMVLRDAQHFERHRRWLAEQDEQENR